MRIMFIGGDDFYFRRLRAEAEELDAASKVVWVRGLHDVLFRLKTQRIPDAIVILDQDPVGCILKIRSHVLSRRIPIIVLSRVVNQTEREECILHGAMHYTEMSNMNVIGPMLSALMKR